MPIITPASLDKMREGFRWALQATGREQAFDAAVHQGYLSYYESLKTVSVEGSRLMAEGLERMERMGFVGARHRFWGVESPTAPDFNRPSLIAIPFPKELLHLPDVNPLLLHKLLRGHPQLVETLEECLEPGNLMNVGDAKRLGMRVGNQLVDVLKPAAVFPYFYAGIVTPEVENEIAAGNFEAPDFMIALPAEFMRLYLEALYIFVTDPNRLKEERPAWYMAFVYALQGHPWSPLHGVLGIIAHIMADLAIGIANTLLKTYREQLINQDPSLKNTYKLAIALCEQSGVALENQPMSFFADLLMDPNNPESVAWLNKRRNDHYKIGPMLERLTPPTLKQFTTWGDDPLAMLFLIIQEYTNATAIAYGKIHSERDLSLVFAERLMEARSTKWGFKKMDDGTWLRFSEEEILYGLKYRSAEMAKNFTRVRVD